ncbi:MAG: helix-turn-helix transcriptional regulator [Acidimicrobiia bacterium]
MGLAQALREKRRDLGLTQDEAAERLKELGAPVSQQTIAKWETGSTRPGRKRAVTEAIASYLGIEYRDALVLIDEEPVGGARVTIMDKLDELGARLGRVEEVVFTGEKEVTPR